MGCRVAVDQQKTQLPLRNEAVRVEDDKHQKIDTREGEHQDVLGYNVDTSEGPVDDTGTVWKVVKRVQAAAGVPGADTAIEISQSAEPMEIDSLAGVTAARILDEKGSLDLEKKEVEGAVPNVINKFEDTVRIDKVSAHDNLGSRKQPIISIPGSGTKEIVVDPSLVIEIGNHADNLHVQKKLVVDSIKGDDNVSKQETWTGGLSSADVQGGKDAKPEGSQSEISAIKDIMPGEIAGGKENLAVPGNAGITNTGGPRKESWRLEYLVKWVGRSHIHNEWVSEEKLRTYAKRKLENYKTKYGTAPLIIMEDQWSQPQRILGRRARKDGSTELLVKWQGLSYDECTWEDAKNPVIESNLDLVHFFDRFEEEALTRHTNTTKENCYSRDIEALAKQPEWLKGGSLFPHQLEALNWLRKSWHRHRNVILADEMGLGKTISACAFLSSLYQEFHAHSPCLVLVPLSTMPNWQAEFSVWAPFLNVIEYHGSAKARAVIREHEWFATPGSTGHDGKHTGSAVYKFNVMLTTYEMVIADSSQLRAVPWEVLIVDEGHRLKNSESKLFTLLNTYKFGHRILLTGTPLQNNLGEMYNLLNFLQPETFPSLGAFEEKFSLLNTAEQVDEIKKLVAPHMLRRLKKDAMQNIPPKVERVVPVELTPVQAEYYRALLTKNYQLLRQVGGGKPGGQQQSMLNIMMQLRKVCNHPYLLVGSEPEGGSPKFLQEMRIKASAKLTLLHSMLQSLKKAGHRVLIFSQMTKLLDILEDYLSFEFGNDSFERVDGSVPVAERQKAIARFNQDPSRFVFLLSTRSCGLGINLATADTVIIYDSDFNPHADIQAMNRAHRIGQSKTLLVYRLVVRASVEERILQLAKKKLMLDHLFANKSGSQKEVEDIIRWGTEELFAEDRSAELEEVPAVHDAANGDASESKTTVMTVEKPILDSEVKNKVDGRDLRKDKALKRDKPLKVVWDDAAITRLLDRSELAATTLEVTEGEQESDWLGSLKVGSKIFLEGCGGVW